MGKQKIIEVRVGPNGEVEIEGHGFTGSECDYDMKFLEDALGNKGDTVKKAEWFLKNSKSMRSLRRVGVDGSKLCG